MSAAVIGWVALGAVVGAPLRFLIDRWVTLRTASSPIPIGLLVVNISGSALLGLVVGLHHPTLTLVAGSGFCGALTTYSGFAWESTRLWSERRGAFWAFVALMVLACLLAFWITWSLATRLA
ncbi:MAG: CrcB family protein [Candidatus Nanopelagicales bacterium]|nr:CrcB family protein [Candidatus Nanopelagicales bacterium]